MFNAKNYGDWRQYCQCLHKAVFSATMIISVCFIGPESSVVVLCNVHICVSSHVSVSLPFWLFACGSKFITYKKPRSTLVHKGIKIGLSRFFEIFCYLNFLQMIVSGSYCKFFLFCCKPTPYIGKFLRLCLPKSFLYQSDCRIFQT